MGKKGKWREAEAGRGGALSSPLHTPRHRERSPFSPGAGPQSAEPRRAGEGDAIHQGTAVFCRAPSPPTLPRGAVGGAGFSNGAMPQNRLLLLEAAAHRPPAVLVGTPVSPAAAACATLAPSGPGARRSVLPAETRLDRALSFPVIFTGLFWGFFFLQLVV